MTPGDVVKVNFPFSSTEEEPFKKRPVLVVAAVGTYPDETIFCAMITSNERRFKRPHPGDVRIDDWQQIGLPLASVVRCRRIWTAESRDVVREPGKPVVRARISPGTLQAVKAELRTLLNL